MTTITYPSAPPSPQYAGSASAATASAVTPAPAPTNGPSAVEVTQRGWTDTRQAGGAGARPTGHAATNAARPPQFDSFDDLGDIWPPPRSVNGITTRGGEHYVRIDGQGTPERVRYDAGGRLLAANGDTLAPVGALTPETTFRRVPASDAPQGPSAVDWFTSGVFPSLSDFSRVPLYQLGSPDANGVYHRRGRQYVDMGDTTGVEVGQGIDGNRRLVMDRTGEPTGPVVARKTGTLLYAADMTVSPGRESRAFSDAPSRFYLSKEDRAILGTPPKHVRVDPAALAAAQARANEKGAELRDAAYRDLPGAVRPTLPAVALPTDPTDRQLVDAAYRGSQGVVVGESHDEPDATAFLNRSFGYLRDQGVDTLFIEYPRENFSGWEGPLKLNGDTAHDDALMELIGGLRGRHGQNDFFRNALEHGLEIKPLDSVVAGASGPDIQSRQSRIASFNHLAQLEINRHQAEHSGKWVAWMGSAHASDDSTGGVSIPGVALTTGARSLVFNSDDVDIPAGRTYAIHTEKSIKHAYGSESRGDIVIDFIKPS